MRIRLAGNRLPDPIDPARPPYGAHEGRYPHYHFSFGQVAGTEKFALTIPTDDPNPAECGPVRYPEQARWIRDLAAACGLVWREEDYPGHFYIDSAVGCSAMIDAMMARGLALDSPDEELEAWRRRESLLP